METMEIDKAADLPQGAGNAQFFRQAGFGGGNAFLPHPWMRAAGIGPQAAGMVLARGTLLQQQLPTIIDEEH